jgi:hypothetical protein
MLRTACNTTLCLCAMLAYPQRQSVPRMWGDAIAQQQHLKPVAPVQNSHVRAAKYRSTLEVDELHMGESVCAGGREAGEGEGG